MSRIHAENVQSVRAKFPDCQIHRDSWYAGSCQQSDEGARPVWWRQYDNVLPFRVGFL